MSIRQMSSKEIAEKVIKKEKVLILDVRNEATFADWKIEGEGISHVNIPYFKLIDGIEPYLDQLPEDEEILVVCAKGNSSSMVSEMLDKTGRSVANLTGGMSQYSQYLHPVRRGDLPSGGEMYQFVRIGKGCLSYMIISGTEAAVVDASRLTEPYLQLAEERGVKIKHVFDTHLHADHISGGRKLAEATGATYWLPPADATEVTFEYQPLENDVVVQIGQVAIDINALYTPGHTIGSTSFVIDNTYLLSGDILFIDSIGRPDLAGLADDWVKDLRESLYVRYKNLSNELIVSPGHFMIVEELNEDGSVGKRLDDLFSENHGLNIKDEKEFRQLVTENLPPQPNAYEEIRKVNMGQVNPNKEEQADMEIGPNRCAVR